MVTKTISVTEADAEVWDEAAKFRGGGTPEGWRAAVARDLLALLPGGDEKDALGTLTEVHRLLLTSTRPSVNARIFAERLEGIVRRLDPAAAAALTEARQAQAGGAA